MEHQSALFIEGCSSPVDLTQKPTSSPNSPTPSGEIDVFVNCQTNPFEHTGKFYNLKLGDSVRVAGITKVGEEEIFDVGTSEQGKLSFSPEQTFSGEGSTKPGILYLRDKNFYMIEEGRNEGKVAQIGISFTCIDAAPKGSQLPQS